MKNFIVMLFLNISCLSFGQKTFTSKTYNFSIQEPMGWFTANKDAIVENLDKVELSEAELKKILNDSKGSLLLAAFYKYDPKTTAGIIPTVQSNVRSKGNATFEQFKRSIIASTTSIKQVFPDFEYIEQPKDITISGVKSVYFVASFTMKSQNGKTSKIRTRTYAIPYKNYFIQVNLTDDPESEDCSKEFDEIVKSIQVAKA